MIWKKISHWISLSSPAAQSKPAGCILNYNWQTLIRAATAQIIDRVCTSLLLYGSQSQLRLSDDWAVKLVLEYEFSQACAMEYQCSDKTGK